MSDNQDDFDAELAAIAGNWLPEPVPWANAWVGTDPRGFGGDRTESRMYSQVTLDAAAMSGESAPRASTNCGTTHRVTAEKEGNTGIVTEETRMATSTQTFGWSSTGSGWTGALDAHGCYPFVSDWVAPAIDYHLDIAVDGSHLELSGWHNGFPAYDLLVDGAVVYQYAPTDSGPGFMNLGFQRVAFSAAAGGA